MDFWTYISYLKKLKLHFKGHACNANMAAFPAKVTKAKKAFWALSMLVFLLYTGCFTSRAISNIRH
jgi:hypothetical protein